MCNLYGVPNDVIKIKVTIFGVLIIVINVNFMLQLIFLKHEKIKTRYYYVSGAVNQNSVKTLVSLIKSNRAIELFHRKLRKETGIAERCVFV